MNIQIKDFEGPFDLLLHLIKQSKMDIYTVNIKEIIDQYIIYINNHDKYNIDLSSEYLVMASELIHIKSKMLINEEIDNEEEEYLIKDEEDLRNKLALYEKYKSITDTFKDLEENRMDYFTKLPENLNDYIEDSNMFNNDITINALVDAFLDMQKRISFLKPSTTKITKKEYSVKKRIIEIRNLLKKKKSVKFEELFETFTKEELIVTFLSLLDMSKMNEILIKQSKAFGSIVIEGVKK